jgi:hypothetical protein
VELVVGGDLFDDLPVFLKEAKMTNEFQQTPLICPATMKLAGRRQTRWPVG